MNLLSIDGINVLNFIYIYNPKPITIIIIIIVNIIGLIFLIKALEGESLDYLFYCACIIIATFIFLAFISNNDNIFNNKSKIKATIEIVDENSWKELGPNFTVLEKVYDNKEIYLIQGKYIES